MVGHWKCRVSTNCAINICFSNINKNSNDSSNIKTRCYYDYVSSSDYCYS